MKTLLVLRHAKSSWKEPGLTDFDRPLNKRGLRDAPRIGELLREEALLPEVIYASAAARTTETANLLIGASGFKGNLERRKELYLASAEQYIQLLRAEGGSAKRIMLIGHNPGMQVLVSTLAGTSETFPTAALAWFDLAIDSWSDLELWPTPTLRMIWRPKEMD